MSLGLLALASGSVYAGFVAVVPEFDGGSATIALGLTLGVVALIQEFRNKK